MNKLAYLSLQTHTDNVITVEETLEKKAEPTLMSGALINSKREARAQALYALFNQHEE